MLYYICHSRDEAGGLGSCRTTRGWFFVLFRSDCPGAVSLDFPDAWASVEAYNDIPFNRPDLIRNGIITTSTIQMHDKIVRLCIHAYGEVFS